LSDIKVLTKYSNKQTEKTSRFIWVYASDEENDLAHNHAPVLDWQSGLENLEQLHQEPIKKDKPKKEEKCQCSVMIVSNIDDFEDEICGIKETLKNLSITEPLELLDRFLETKNATYLSEAIEKTRNIDLVSVYKLNKISEKIKII